VLDQQEALDRVFRALADPTRRNILERLSEHPVSVSRLAEPIEMTLTGVLQHVRVLETSGLVRTEKRGRTRTCRLEIPAMREAEAWLAARRGTWQTRFDRLEGYLAGSQPAQTAPEEPATNRPPT
jgi:DNA-binding transcriptional ArsR family regulator